MYDVKETRENNGHILKIDLKVRPKYFGRDVVDLCCYLKRIFSISGMIGSGQFYLIAPTDADVMLDIQKDYEHHPRCLQIIKRQ